MQSELALMVERMNAEMIVSRTSLVTAAMEELDTCFDIVMGGVLVDGHSVGDAGIKDVSWASCSSTSRD